MKRVVLIGLSSEQHPNEFNKDPNNVQYATNASWAAISHYPALQQLKNKFFLRGILNSTEQSGNRIANILEQTDPNLNVYLSEEEVSRDTNVDLVVISVGVRHHFKIIMKLTESPAFIYSEWPLALSLQESEKILASRKSNIKTTVVGLQSRKSPQILMAKRLIESGALGKILRTRALGYCGSMWNGKVLEDSPDYFLNSENGQTLFTIPFAHLFDAIMYTLGLYPVRMFAEVINRHPEFVVVNEKGEPTGKVKKNGCPNDVLVSGTFENNIMVSVNAIPGTPVNKDIPGLKWEIFGTEGYIEIEANSSFVELEKLSLKYFDKHGNMTFSNMKDYNPFSQNVKQMYEAIESQQEEAQGFGFLGVPTFKDAVILHRILDKFILSSETGEVVNFADDDFYKF